MTASVPGRKLINAIFILVVAVVFSSCSNTQYQELFKEKGKLSDTSYHTPAVGEYRIKAQDILQIRFLQDSKYLVNVTPNTTVNTNVLNANPVDNQNFQVDDDGTVILPAIGSIKVAGYTRLEAQKLVEDAYRKNVLVNPIIELKIVSLKVTLFGEVKTQGNLPLLKEHTTLVEIIGAAGGLTERGNETNIKIIRGTQKTPKVIVVDLSDIQSINSPESVLQNGDIIYIAQNKRATRNDNLQNFTTVFQPLLLLFNTALIVLTLIRR